MLVLIRHAKSSWTHEGLSDFERPLNERGREDIIVMAEHLSEHAPCPRQFLSSAAERAMETSSGLIREMNCASLQPDVLNELYMASADEILHTIQRRGRAEILYVCAHNPGVSQFLKRIIGSDAEPLSTLGTVLCDYDGPWEHAQWENLRVREILSPASLRSGAGTRLGSGPRAGKA
ncbi:MAG: SixA phosphatase family protein [Salinispira sp.]